MALSPMQKRRRREWLLRATVAWENGMNGVTDVDLYAVGGNEPAVVADFVNEYYRVGGSATTFASMFTFSRTGTATYFDSNGILQTAADGVARVGNHVYNGTSWVNKGVLIESEARTNLLTYSNDFNNAAYASFQMTFTEGQTNALTGASDATLLNSSGVSGAINWNEAITVATSTVHTFSVFAKANGANWLRLSVSGFTTPADGGVYFNLSTGAIGTTSSGLTARVINYGGGWYRCCITFTTDAADTTGTLLLNIAEGDGDQSWASFSGTESIYVYGIQFEAGSTPSSYIPTAGTAVTRNADSLVIAAANMSASTSAMSLQLDGTITYADEGAAAQQTFLRWQTDASNYISLDLDTDGAATGEVNANQAVGGTVDTVVAGAEYTAGVNVAFNIASRHTSGAINVAKDGTAATADTTPASLVDLSARNCELFQDAMGNISQFRQWAVDLGDAGIEAASS